MHSMQRVINISIRLRKVYGGVNRLFPCAKNTYPIYRNEIFEDTLILIFKRNSFHCIYNMFVETGEKNETHVRRANIYQL